MASRFDVVRHLVTREVTQVLTDGSESGLVGLLRELEELKASCAAAQAEAAVAFDAAVRARRATEGVPAARRGRGVAEEVALARRESPHRGARLLGLAHTLVEQMPHTLGALRSGTISEFRAGVVVTETACLASDDRVAADGELCADRSRIESWGTARLAGEARRVAYRLDPEAYVARAGHAREERHVSLRPAPDTMTWLSALLPVEHGVAVRATLARVADAAVSAGDGRSRGQVMADALVQSVTSLDLGAPVPAAVPVRVNLTVSDETLLGGGIEPGWLDGYGPLPAQLARDLVTGAEGQARAELRRLYVTPETGVLVAMESRSRLFPSGLAQLIAVRDQVCRTPWCGAPVRQVDHVVGWDAGGATSVENGQGLCVRCNLAKQAGGWVSTPVVSTGPPGGPHQVEIASPAGQRASSRAPDLPPPRRWRDAAPVRTVVLEIYRRLPHLELELGA